MVADHVRVYTQVDDARANEQSRPAAWPNPVTDGQAAVASGRPVVVGSTALAARRSRLS